MQFQEHIFLPTGYRFRPSDDELVGDYLHNKISGMPLSCGIIKECDLYGTQEIWEIWDAYGGPKIKEDDDLYFFTRLKKKSAKTSRISRRVGTGTWEGEDSAKPVTDEKTKREIGYKKRFRYENRNSEHHGRWIMHQYSLLGNDEFVLCRIRKNDNDEGVRKGRKRKAEVEECAGKGRKRKVKDCVGKRRERKGEDEESCVCSRVESEAPSMLEPEPQLSENSNSEEEYFLDVTEEDLAAFDRLFPDTLFLNFPQISTQQLEILEATVFPDTVLEYS